MTDHTGRTASVHHVVSTADTALALGSGTVPVLGTPRLLAWLEEATVSAAGDLPGEGRTSVGTDVELRHLRPSPVGSTVETTAELVARDERTLTFAVAATSPDHGLLAEGSIRRAIVAIARFAGTP